MAKIHVFSEESGYIADIDAVNTEDAKTAVMQELDMQNHAGDRLIFVDFESKTVSFARVVCALEDY